MNFQGVRVILKLGIKKTFYSGCGFISQNILSFFNALNSNEFKKCLNILRNRFLTFIKKYLIKNQANEFDQFEKSKNAKANK